MAPSRAYVPSRALIRALSRPLPQTCPFARRPPTNFTRGKRTQAAKLEKPATAPMSSKQMAENIKAFEQGLEDATKDENLRPLTDKELESGYMPDISFYEQDIDRGTPRELVRRLSTPEDWKKEQEMYGMIEESVRNPDYEDAHLNRRLIDELIANPKFAHLTQDLKEIKEEIHTKEELEVLERESEEEMQREHQANLKEATRGAMQDLLDDPDASAAKAELQEVIDRLPEVEDAESPAFRALLEKAMSKLNDDPTFQKKLATMDLDKMEAEVDKEYSDYEREIDEALAEEENGADDAEAVDLADPGDMDKLLAQMRDLLKSIDGGSPVAAELEAVLAEDPNAVDEADMPREMDFAELSSELIRLAKSNAPTAQQEQPIEEEEEHVPEELQKKVDEIMQDPKLMEKLVYIQSLIAQQQASALPTNPSAPDPTKLPAKRITTVEQRIQLASSDPQHTAALARLRVHLHPPYNISPALKSFNTAIELAYIGANDDIRRILWRSYSKARTLPTFLRSLSDEAWDILYYSQAVTWGSNQNRQAHLRLMLEDLKSVGRDGPPTHPSTLVEREEGEYVEA